MAEKTKVNTTKSIREAVPVTAGQLDAEMKKAAKVLGEQELEEVHIPKYLEKRLGKNVPVVINGAVIHVPVGEKVKIPRAMAEVLNQSLEQLSI